MSEVSNEGGKCACRWEAGPVQIEEPAYDDFTQVLRNSSFGRIRYYREVKHWVSPECEVHRELLRPIVGTMVERFKEQYPQLVELSKTLTQAEDKEAAYFEFSHFRMRVPRDVVESGRVNMSTTMKVDSEGRGVGLPIAEGLAYQFFETIEAVRWANDQACWLVWKRYDDDPRRLENPGRLWLTVWDPEDKYFWPADHELGEQHCARCHHVCSRFCVGMTGELSRDHTARGECNAHWIGCPGC